MAMIPPPMPQRLTPLQQALSEINYAFDLLDHRGTGIIGRWDLLKGMMDTPEVRGLLRLGAAANQAELDELIREMAGEGESVGRHEFESFFVRRELERSGGGGGGAGEPKAAAGGKGGGQPSKDGDAKKGGTVAKLGSGGTGAPVPSQYTLPTGYTVPGYNAPGGGMGGGVVPGMGMAPPPGYPYHGPPPGLYPYAPAPQPRYDYFGSVGYGAGPYAGSPMGTPSYGAAGAKVGGPVRWQ